jgi:Zn-dependent membrane protease YugP
MNCFAFVMMWDPMSFLIMAPGLLLALWAQMKVKSAFNYAKQHPAGSGMSGAETAARILEAHNINDVTIEPTDSWLGDHYDSAHKVLRLSPDVYNGRSLASLGIAAHEVGHAIQHSTAYGPLALRNGLVPAAQIGTNMAYFLIVAGVLFQPFRFLAIVGLLAFCAAVVFQLVTLPVEFDASRRARAILLNNGMVTQSEDAVVGKVLNAAALTYVAAAITALLNLLYYAMIVFGDRRR